MADCGHERIEVVSRCPDCGQELGHAQFSRQQLARKGGLSPEELAAQGGTELPDREALSLVNANVAAPVIRRPGGRLTDDLTPESVAAIAAALVGCGVRARRVALVGAVVSLLIGLDEVARRVAAEPAAGVGAARDRGAPAACAP